MKKLNLVRPIILAGSLLLCAWPGAGTAQAQSPGSVVAWGNNSESQVPVAAQSGMTAIAAGTYHTVALKNDGSVVSWGYYYYYDETESGWTDDYDFGQTTVPVAAQSGVTTIAAGFYHTVALKSDGSVLAWRPYGFTLVGNTYYTNYDFGQTDVPVAAQSGVTAIAAGEIHTVALKNDGSVVAWGFNRDGQTTVPVAAQSGVTAIAAGSSHTVALKSNGSVVAWGNNHYGQTTVPVAAQNGVTTIAAGYYHTVALKNNGSVLAWGEGAQGQTTVPLAAQSGVTAIAAGASHTVALKSDGSVVAWGYNGSGQTDVPVAAQSGVTAIAAGTYHTVALLGTAPPPSPRLTIIRSGANVILTWLTHAAGFTLQSTTNLFPTAWTPVVQSAVTNAGQISVTVPTTVGRKFFRLKSQ